MRDITKDIELVEAASGQQFFHATFETRIPGILEKGLQTGKRRNWSYQMGGKQGSTKLVYLFADFTSAVRWAANMEWEFKKPIVIVVVRDPPGLLTPDDHIQMSLHGYEAFTTDEPIPPECIVKTVPLTLEMKRAIAQTGKAELTQEGYLQQC